MAEEAGDLVLALTTLRDADEAGALARRLVEERLIACGNVLPGLTSIFRWQGRIEENAEALLLMKTRGELVVRLQERLTELHPYDVPEFIAVRASEATAAYRDWVRDETNEVNG